MQTSTDTKPMHDSPKLTAFIALRANGWSLASISLEIDVPKSTLWDWDTKHRDQVLRLKQFQLEKFQEYFIPTYEEELKRLRAHLDRLEDALEDVDFHNINPGYLLQLALQVRARLASLRRQTTPRQTEPSAPIQSLETAGRVTYRWEDQFTDEELADALAYNPDLAPPPEASSESAPAPQNPVAASCQNAADPQNQNRTNPDETPRGVENKSLSIKHLQKPPENSRPVLHPQNEPCGHQSKRRPPASLE